MYEAILIEPVDGYQVALACWQLDSVLTCKLNTHGADILCGLVIRSGDCIWTPGVKSRCCHPSPSSTG